jgi:hypothetical protein
MQLIDDDEEENDHVGAGKLAEASKAGEEGMDSEWNRRMEDKLERMKNKKMRLMSITVTQKNGLSGALASRQRKTYNRGESGVSGQGRVREELTKREGTIEFLTGDADGSVDICVQSILASRENPSRTSLNVTMQTTRESEEEEDEKTEEKKPKDGDEGNLPHDAVKSQMSRMERDMVTLNNRVRACLSNADFNKDQEVAMHDQSVAMQRAATYWPIIQLLVLLVTAFTQVNHIVRFLKSHHIGL